MFGKPLHRWHQRGAIIVFTAVLLPLLMACMGFAFDLGNLYIHKSRLQNAADAAALAGAREYAIQEETLASHPEADEEADRYVDSDAQNRNLPNAIERRPYKAIADDDAVYYRVSLKENVPLYFLRIFGLTDQDVSADSVAAIGMVTESDGGGGSSSGSGRDLFIFKHDLRLVNTIENPDNFDSKGQIRTTFDGNIAFTDGSGNNKDNQSNYMYRSLQYTTQSDSLGVFLTSKARDEGLSVNEAKEKGSGYTHERIFEDYDMTELGTLTRSRLGLPDEVSPVTDWSDWQAAQKQQEAYDEYLKHFRLAGTNDPLTNKFSSKDLSSDVAFYNAPSDKGGNRSMDFTIDGTVSGDPNTPVYVYIDSSLNDIVHVYVNGDNVRPIVFCYMGTGKFYVEYNGAHTFSGVFYAPNTSHFHINSNNGNFEGTIIADSMDIEGGTGTYRYKDFGVNTGSSSSSGSGSGSGSSTGKKTVKSSSTVRLVSPGDLNWD